MGRIRLVTALVCTGILLAIIVTTGACSNQLEGNTQGKLQQFKSYEDLAKFLKSAHAYPSYYYEGRGLIATLGQGGHEASDSSNMPDYSGTNIQVAGVDEADIVKTDGEFIYLALDGRLAIIRAYPAEEAGVVSEIKIQGTLRGLFVNGDRLALFVEEHQDYYQQSDSIRSYSPKTSMDVYDISSRENPVHRRTVAVEGMYWNSRMIGDYVYVIAHAYTGTDDGEIKIPSIHCGEEVIEIPASKILHSPVPDYSYMFTLVVAMNVKDDNAEPTFQSLLLGAASNLYVTQGNIYVTFPAQWGQYRMMDDGSFIEKTRVHRIRIDGGEIEYEASGEVNGRVLNQFSMDEHDKYFRIATTTGHSWGAQAESESHVFVLDSSLEVVGSLEGLAPGEQIYSARFVGSRCYLVTFKSIDPLFVIDLKNPRNPKVLGELKITGYSDYLHLYDENHLIGIGKETVEAEGGDFAWYQGVKISLFDVSDVGAPKEVGKYVIGDRGTDSPILRDHKALLFDRAKNLLVIPVLVAEISEDDYPGGVPDWAYGRYVWQGAYVMNVSLEEGLTQRGTITHCNSVQFSGYGYYNDECFVERSLYIGDVLYTISGSKIKMNELDGLNEIGEISLTDAEDGSDLYKIVP